MCKLASIVNLFMGPYISWLEHGPVHGRAKSAGIAIHVCLPKFAVRECTDEMFLYVPYSSFITSSFGQLEGALISRSWCFSASLATLANWECPLVQRVTRQLQVVRASCKITRGLLLVAKREH
jgi:hypothetical protein